MRSQDYIERRRIARRKWAENNPERMEKCRENWRQRNLSRILQKRRERVERITGRKVIPRQLVSDEEKRRKARLRSSRWYQKNKHKTDFKLRARLQAQKYRMKKGKIVLSPSQSIHRLTRQKRWRSNNPEKLRMYDRRSMQNPQSAIKRRLRSRIATVLRRKNVRKSSKTVDLIGCTWSFLKSHIEKQFVDGMLWSNRNQWHIDHIRPCASFDLTDRQQQLACFHYSNLRPLWSQENMKKHAKWQEAA